MVSSGTLRGSLRITVAGATADAETTTRGESDSDRLWTFSRVSVRMSLSVDARAFGLPVLSTWKRNKYFEVKQNTLIILLSRPNHHRVAHAVDRSNKIYCGRSRAFLHPNDFFFQISAKRTYNIRIWSFAFYPTARGRVLFTRPTSILRKWHYRDDMSGKPLVYILYFMRGFLHDLPRCVDFRIWSTELGEPALKSRRSNLIICVINICRYLEEIGSKVMINLRRNVFTLLMSNVYMYVFIYTYI